MEYLQRARELFDYTVSLRRHFHTWPECLPDEQVRTMEKVCRELDDMGIPWERVPDGGIFGFIEGGRPGKTLLLRGDMDALPIREDERNLSGPRVCVSQIPGVMHACGHDAHTAMLLTEARMLKELAPELPGRVILMFEQGEEGGFGILEMLRHMHRTGMKPDGAYACHTLWSLPAGMIGVTDGASMSGMCHFVIRIHGQTGHGSRPDQGHNVIDCFAQIYGALQNVRMTCIEPGRKLTYSICTVHAGDRHNVLPDTLEAEGTVRFDRTDCGMRFLEKLGSIAQACGGMCGCGVEVERVTMHHPVTMAEECRSLLRRSVTAHLGDDHLAAPEMWMASESFSHMADMVPSAFAFVGIRNERLGSGAPHHSAQFDVDEEAMVWGTAAAVGYAVDFLNDPRAPGAFTPMAQDFMAYLTIMGH